MTLTNPPTEKSWAAQGAADAIHDSGKPPSKWRTIRLADIKNSNDAYEYFLGWEAAHNEPMETKS